MSASPMVPCGVPDLREQCDYGISARASIVVLTIQQGRDQRYRRFLRRLRSDTCLGGLCCTASNVLSHEDETQNTERGTQYCERRRVAWRRRSLVLTDTKARGRFVVLVQPSLSNKNRLSDVVLSPPRTPCRPSRIPHIARSARLDIRLGGEGDRFDRIVTPR
jgi:hypothetical protein